MASTLLGCLSLYFFLIPNTTTHQLLLLNLSHLPWKFKDQTKPSEIRAAPTLSRNQFLAFLAMTLQSSTFLFLSEQCHHVFYQETGVSDTPKTECRVEIEFFPAPANPHYPVPWTEQQWKNTLSKEELKQRCSRCKEIGHCHHHCPYPVHYQRVQDVGGCPERVVEVVWTPPKGVYRCSRCGRRGHNRRTCHGPVFY